MCTWSGSRAGGSPPPRVSASFFSTGRAKRGSGYDVGAAAVHLKGRGDFLCMFVFDIAPSSATTPQRHLYEEVFYVLEGRGSTTIETPDGRRHSFEWGPRSLFAIPLNTRYRLFNASGSQGARLVSTTSLPAAVHMFHHEGVAFAHDCG